jgi:hypothetical protein
MLVGSVDRRVDTDVPVDRAQTVGVREQRGVDPVPRAVPGEAAVSLPRRLPRSEVRRQVTPGNPRPEPIHDRLDQRAVITKTVTPLAIRGRHQRLDQLPLGIGQDRRTGHVRTITAANAHIRETRPRSFDRASAVRWPPGSTSGSRPRRSRANCYGSPDR